MNKKNNGPIKYETEKKFIRRHRTKVLNHLLGNKKAEWAKKTGSPASTILLEIGVALVKSASNEAMEALLNNVKVNRQNMNKALKRMHKELIEEDKKLMEKRSNEEHKQR